MRWGTQRQVQEFADSDPEPGSRWHRRNSSDRQSSATTQPGNNAPDPAARTEQGSQARPATATESSAADRRFQYSCAQSAFECAPQPTEFVPAWFVDDN